MLPEMLADMQLRRPQHKRSIDSTSLLQHPGSYTIHLQHIRSVVGNLSRTVAKRGGVVSGEMLQACKWISGAEGHAVTPSTLNSK